jgi:glycine/D-amino acid oxidase-like deaminating enzyme
MTESPWRATFELPRFPALAGPITTDVAIVGGGISGLTAAGMIVSDLILGKPNRYAALYDATRIRPFAETATTMR